MEYHPSDHVEDNPVHSPIQLSIENAEELANATDVCHSPKRLSTTLMYTEWSQTYKITPEYFQGYFYMVWCFIFVFTGVITAFWGEIDWEDNIIYNELGVNSICVLFDYKPAIYLTPFLSCLLVVAATFYMFGYNTRIFLLRQINLISEREFRMFQATFVLETVSYFFMVSVFSINEENVRFHFTAYCQAILVQVLMGWRNLYYLYNFGHLTDLKKKVLIVWTLIFSYMGTHYSIGMLLWLHHRVESVSGDDDTKLWWMLFLDIGFTCMFFIGHIFAGCFVNDDGKTLIVSVVLKDGKMDAPGQLCAFWQAGGRPQAILKAPHMEVVRSGSKKERGLVFESTLSPTTPDPPRQSRLQEIVSSYGSPPVESLQTPAENIELTKREEGNNSSMVQWDFSVHDTTSPASDGGGHDSTNPASDGGGPMSP